MSRFNTASPGTKTVNLAGGEAYSQTPELELLSILLTSFAKDDFYRSANETFNRLKALITQVKPEFVAKAAVYARTQFGMRSITHVVASELAKHLSGREWAKNFYAAIIHRPDDMIEILSYHKANGKVPASMKKGFAKAFDKFDKYTLAKYRAGAKSFKLVDVVNMVHPVPTEKNSEAIAALIKGDLKSFDTWEVELSKAGQSEGDTLELKKDAWASLINSGKIGYFALLRNLRNIIGQAPEALPKALELLVDENRISKSLVLPFRFSTAYDEISKLSSAAARTTLVGISKAVDISLRNVPKFEGETLVVLDVSGSMSGKPSQIGSLFSAILVKSNNCDMMTFDSDAQYRSYNPLDSTLTIQAGFRFNGGSTNFHSIFQRANKRYERIIILSDMQGWVGYDSPVREFEAYKKRTGANPFIYSFDLNGYGSMQFPQNKVVCLAGFSDKIFDIMKFVEADKNALINEVNKIQF